MGNRIPVPLFPEKQKKNTISTVGKKKILSLHNDNKKEFYIQTLPTLPTTYYRYRI